MDIPLGVENVAIGLSCGPSQEAKDALGALVARLSLIAQDAVTSPDAFNPSTFPGVNWQAGNLTVRFSMLTERSLVPGGAFPVDAAVQVLHCPAHTDLLAEHKAVQASVNWRKGSKQVPVETICFYPTDAQLADERITSAAHVHLVLPGQEVLSCRYLLANILTRVYQDKLQHVGFIEGQCGLQAQHLLASGTSGALPHLLDGQAVAAAVALCCAASSTSLALGDASGAWEYALVAQRLVDTSLRDIALGAADLLETNRLSVQCSLAMGLAVWFAAAQSSTPAPGSSQLSGWEPPPEGQWKSSEPAPPPGLHGRSVKRWQIAADALVNGANAAAAVVVGDAKANMLLSPLPPSSHAPLMFMQASTAYMVAAQTSLDGNVCLAGPQSGSPQRKRVSDAASAAPWSCSAAAAKAALSAVQTAESALQQAYSDVQRGPASSAPSDQARLRLCADVCLAVSATLFLTLGTAQNIPCRAPRRAWGCLKHPVHTLASCGFQSHALVLACAALGAAGPSLATALAAGIVWQAQPAAGTAASADTSSSKHGPRGGSEDSFAGAVGTGMVSPRRAEGGHAASTAIHGLQPRWTDVAWRSSLADLMRTMTSCFAKLGLPSCACEAALVWAGLQGGFAAAPSGLRWSGQPGAAMSSDADRVLQAALTRPVLFLQHAAHPHTVGGCFRGMSSPLCFHLALSLSNFLRSQSADDAGPFQHWDEALLQLARPVSHLPWLSDCACSWQRPLLKDCIWMRPRILATSGQRTVSPSRMFGRRGRRAERSVEEVTTLHAFSGDVLSLSCSIRVQMGAPRWSGGSAPFTASVMVPWGHAVPGAEQHAEVHQDSASGGTPPTLQHGKAQFQLMTTAPAHPGRHVIRHVRVQWGNLEAAVPLGRPLQLHVCEAQGRLGVPAEFALLPVEGDGSLVLSWPTRRIGGSTGASSGDLQLRSACLALPSSLTSLPKTGAAPAMHQALKLDSTGVELSSGELRLAGMALSDACQALGAGPGEQLSLLAWYQGTDHEAQSAAAGRSLQVSTNLDEGQGQHDLAPVSVLRLDFTVPSLPEAWPPNGGPWAPEAPARAAFWETCFTAGVEDRGAQMGHLMLRLDSTRLPSRLVEACRGASAGEGLCVAWEVVHHDVEGGWTWLGGAAKGSKGLIPTSTSEAGGDPQAPEVDLGQLLRLPGPTQLSVAVEVSYPGHAGRLTCHLAVPVTGLEPGEASGDV